MANPQHVKFLLSGAAFGRSLDADPVPSFLDLSAFDFSYYDLSGAHLEGANLRHAVLSRAVLHGADLRGADLRHADLRNADLSGADLRGADLRHADLCHAVLTNTDLRDADLVGTTLEVADSDARDESVEEPGPVESCAVSNTRREQDSTESSTEEAISAQQESSDNIVDAGECRTESAPDTREQEPICSELAAETRRYVTFVHSRRPFRFRICPGTASEDVVAAVLTSLDELQRAAGGSGLIFDAKGFTVQAIGIDDASAD